MSEQLNDTLTRVGTGLGNMFDNIGAPLLSFIVVITIVAAIAAILRTIAHVITRELSDGYGATFKKAKKEYDFGEFLNQETTKKYIVIGVLMFSIVIMALIIH